MVSANNGAKLLKLTNKKCQADGSVLQKKEQFFQQGVDSDFFKDGQSMAKIIPRLDEWQNA